MSARQSKLIDWKSLGRERFERMVEALISKEFENEEVLIPDGRGGDAGIDASVRTIESYTIFQFKYFTDGFPTHYKSRRNQIRSSFKTALKHAPTDWILVIPGNTTPSEYEFVQNLQTEDHPNLRISVWGRSKLDVVASKHPDIVSFFNRDDDLERLLANIGEEAHAPKSTTDIKRRLDNIAEGAATMDEDWTLDFSRTGSGNTFALRPKHPRAHEISPVKIGLSLDFPPEESDLKRIWSRHYEYGIGSSITLPSHVVRGFRIEGPSFLETTGDLSRIVMSDLEDSRDALKCIIEAISDDRVTGSFRGLATRFGTGIRGISVELKFYETVSLAIPIPADRSSSEGDITLSPGEFSADADTTHKSARLMRALHESEILKIFISGNQLCTLKCQSNALSSDIEHFKIIEDYSSDIKFIEAKLGVDIGIPEEISDYTRAVARSVRLILDGYMTRHPSRASFGVELDLNASDNPTISEMLSGKAHSLKFETESHEVTIGDSKIALGPVAFYSPSTVLEYVSESTSSTESVETDKALVKTEDGKPMFWFIESGIRQDSNGAIASSAWNVLNVEEF
ncbi:hypothetical protein BAUR920_03577 [Brevibacterium aurantiacum]|uniref:Restriction endonuclease type IV Mrr domain-containing protein n=2 Tax=Brevibacterium aurantiacum TaxID=273384 RepID=A0A2H1KTK0_BREAU|nr:hypothetical protein BAUR920_03577 [Brevibacterium aurantiacum]